MRKFKDVVSVVFLFIIIGTYSGYYFNAPFMHENVSLITDKIRQLNELLSPRVEGRSILKDFSTIEELVNFLQNDDTNEIVYSPNFVCHHFTETLIRNARDEGYRLEYLGLYGDSLQNYENDYVSYLASFGIIGVWGEGEGHAVCMAYLGDKIIIIEPQSDVILYKEDGRYYGISKGES